MTTPQELTFETEINARGLNAPRLTPADIDAAIVSETFTMTPSGKTMVCELVLKNGFSIIGLNSCVSRENFREDIAQEKSRQLARDKVWELLSFDLHTKVQRSLELAQAAINSNPSYTSPL